MSKAEALLKVVGSRPENLADNLATLMPNATAVYQKILDLKVQPALGCLASLRVDVLPFSTEQGV